MHHKQGKSDWFDSCDWPSNLTQIGLKLSIFQPVWPWSLMDDPEKQWGTSSVLHQALCIISNPSVNSTLSYSLEMLNLGQNRWFFVQCDLEIWWMTLKNTRASLLWNFKLCALFHNHQWIQTRVTVRKCPIWSKSVIFGPTWLWNLTDDHKKQWGTSSMLL